MLVLSCTVVSLYAQNSVAFDSLSKALIRAKTPANRAETLLALSADPSGSLFATIYFSIFIREAIQAMQGLWHWIAGRLG